VKLHELADQLNELVAKGHGDSEVRLRASHGDHIQVRSGVHGIQRELKFNGVQPSGTHDVSETILLWGCSE
jgi:hypothetical protein